MQIIRVGGRRSLNQQGPATMKIEQLEFASPCKVGVSMLIGFLTSHKAGAMTQAGLGTLMESTASNFELQETTAIKETNKSGTIVSFISV